MTQDRDVKMRGQRRNRIVIQSFLEKPSLNPVGNYHPIPHPDTLHYLSLLTKINGSHCHKLGHILKAQREAENMQASFHLQLVFLN